MSRKAGKLRGRLRIEKSRIQKLERENKRLRQTRSELMTTIENFEKLKRLDCNIQYRYESRSYGVMVQFDDRLIREIQRIRGPLEKTRDESWFQAESLLGCLIGQLAKFLRTGKIE